MTTTSAIQRHRRLTMAARLRSAAARTRREDEDRRRRLQDTAAEYEGLALTGDGSKRPTL